MTSTAGVVTRAGSRSVDVGSVFAVAWAAATLVHLLNQTGGDLARVSWLDFAAALWLLGRPSSGHRLAALAAAQLVDTLWLMPFTPDHQILAAFVNVVILTAYFRRGRPARAEEVVVEAAPGARVLLLIAYAAAATAKYNTDFLDPDTSCAGAIANFSTFGIFDHHSFGAAAFVVITITSESLIPLLLLMPWTRRWGVMYAATFHYFVSLSPAMGVGDFTLTLWSLYLLFLPVADVEAFGQRVVQRWREIPLVAAIGGVPRWYLAGLFGVLVLVAQPAAVHLAVWLVTAGVGLVVLVTGFLVLRAGSHGVRRFGKLRPVHLLVAGVMLAWVAGPYLGFGTSSRFTMFSGLRTEGPGTNHLFLPSYHLIDSQNDALIVISETGDSRLLETAAEHHAAIPVTELRRYLQKDSVGGTFETLDGRRIVVVAGQDHPLRHAPPWWESKTQHYRPYKVVGITDGEFCSN